MAESSTIAIAHNAPFTMEWIMRIAAIGILVSGAVSFSLLPGAVRNMSDRGRGWCSSSSGLFSPSRLFSLAPFRP